MYKPIARLFVLVLAMFAALVPPVSRLEPSVVNSPTEAAGPDTMPNGPGPEVPSSRLAFGTANCFTTTAFGSAAAAWVVSPPPQLDITVADKSIAKQFRIPTAFVFRRALTLERGTAPVCGSQRQ